MNLSERRKLTDALLASPTVRDRNTRDMIVDELPVKIRTGITRSETDRIDVMNILKRVSDFDDGIIHLMESVQFYEGDSQPMQDVQELYDQVYSTPASVIQGESIPAADSIDSPADAQYTDEVSDSASVAENDSQGTGPNPNDFDKYYNRGSAYFNLGLYAQAIRDYNQAIKLAPENAKTYYNRGNVYRRLGQNRQAIEDYDRAIQLCSEYAKAYYNRGITYKDLGQDEQAIGDYSQAIQINPEYVKAYNARALAYQRLGQHDKAAEDFEKVIQLTS